MLSPTEFAAKVACSQRAVSKALIRGDIQGASRSKGGHWSIPDDCPWRPSAARARPIDASDFLAGTVSEHPASIESRRENSRELRRFLNRNATPEQAEEALAWMRRHGAELPQLPDDPALDRAMRRHPLVA